MFRFASPEQRQRVQKQTLEMQKPTTSLEMQEPSTSKDLQVEPVPAPPVDDEPVPGTCNDTCLKPPTAVIEAENYFLRQDVSNLNQQLRNLQVSFGYEHIKNSDSSVLMYTGIPSAVIFEFLFQTMDQFKVTYYSGWNVEKLTKIDQLLLTLIKLRLNLPHDDLAIRFNCSRATVKNVFMTWLYALHEVLFKQLMATIPTRQKNRSCLPAAFATFTNCRIIIDCTELYTAVPKNLEKQRLTYSSYKHRNTWNVLVGVAPNGVVTYVSKVYPGSLSDKKIVKHCGILS